MFSPSLSPSGELLDEPAGEPARVELLAAVFSPAAREPADDAEAAAFASSAAAAVGLVRSKVSFRHGGDGPVVPVLVPASQADGAVTGEAPLDLRHEPWVVDRAWVVHRN